ncbi:MAG: Hsp20/alpha crystallin family protein [Candidatus Pacebacteria bacterium]|nr:Hsp20/alpha crystallin family protein [Candidatus Paceibacterota bacterium]
MPSFFEKLKKGMGIEESLAEPEEEIETEETEEVEEKQIKVKAAPAPKARKLRVKKPKKLGIQSKREIEVEIEEKEPEQEAELPQEPETTPEIEETETEEKMEEKEEEKKKWPVFGERQEGQLAIDVYQTENDLVIQSAIAGVRPETLDIAMERDIVTIRGSREKPFMEEGDYFAQECFWGPFSREVIMPTEVDPDRAEAIMKDGILTIRIPKILRDKKRRIVVRG